MTRKTKIITVAVAAFIISQIGCSKAQTDFPSEPLQQTVSETRTQIRPGITHIHRVTADPLNIHVLLIDLKVPGVSVKTGLSNGKVSGTETVLSMVNRTGAVAGVNGDYWSPNGIPQGLMVYNGEVLIAPKYRTAVAITKDNRALIGKWTDGWTWQSSVTSPDGSEHPIVMMNSDLGEDWLCLYSDKYGLRTHGNRLSPITEIVLDRNRKVTDIRVDQPGRFVPAGGFILSGRGTAGMWLQEKFKIGDPAILNIKSSRSLDDLQQAVSAGPQILKNGEFVQDPIALFPDGEEFELSWKRSHYLYRQPRTAAGVSRDGSRLVLITIDGRMSDFSMGIHQRETADLLKEFGAWDGMDLDSGGSTTMVIDGKRINHPSDGASADGSGGRDRAVANGLLIFFDED